MTSKINVLSREYGITTEQIDAMLHSANQPRQESQQPKNESSEKDESTLKGILAGVLDGLRRGGINVQEMENIIFKGGAAACARLHLAGAPGPALLDELSASEHIFAVSLVSLES